MTSKALLKPKCRTTHYACDCVLEQLRLADRMAEALGRLTVECNHKPRGWEVTDIAYRAYLAARKASKKGKGAR